LPRLFPGLVERKETRLATSLNELIWLRDELGVVHPVGDMDVWSDRIGRWIPGNLGDLDRRVLEVCLDLGVWRDRRCTLQPVGEKELCVVLADGYRNRGEKAGDKM